MHDWFPPDLKPIVRRLLELKVKDGLGVYKLPFPCRFKADGHYYSDEWITRISVKVVAWKYWDITK